MNFYLLNRRASLYDVNSKREETSSRETGGKLLKLLFHKKNPLSKFTIHLNIIKAPKTYIIIQNDAPIVRSL